jgi:hypothetical protein
MARSFGHGGRRSYHDGGHLTMAQRRRLPRSDFAIPERAPGPGSYPIEDADHARNALARVEQHGSTSDKRRVKAAVHRKYPGIEQEGG